MELVKLLVFAGSKDLCTELVSFSPFHFKITNTFEVFQILQGTDFRKWSSIQ